MNEAGAAQLRIRPFNKTDRTAAKTLWGDCGLTRPWNDPDTDIDLAVAGPGSALLVGECDGILMATAMVGFDGHRGWVYYLAVAPGHGGNGYGRQMMAAAEKWLSRHGAPKVQLMVRQENAQALGFYEALGYVPQPVSVFGKRLDT